MKRFFFNHSAPRFFLEEDAGGGDGGAAVEDSPGDLSEFEPPDGPPVPALDGRQERVEGEKLPDFSFLGKGAKPAEKPLESTIQPPKVEKPAGEAPASDKAAAKPKAKAAEAPKEAKPAEVAPAKPEAKAETKPETAPTKAEIPADEEIDAMQPKPGAPTHIVKSFTEIRGKLKATAAQARAYAAEAETARKEIETLKASSGQIPEETQKELEGLRNFNRLFNAERDPHFRAAYVEKISQAEESIFSFLKGYKLSDEVISQIKSVAEKNGGEIEAWPKWNDLVSAISNPIDRQQLLQMLQDRRGAIAAKSSKLAEIGQSREKFDEAMKNLAGEDQKKFGAEIEKASMPFVTDHPWIANKELPANATADQKAAIEAHNAQVAKYADKFGDHVRAAYLRDPAKTAEVAFRAVQAEVLAEENKTIIAERDKAIARTKDLETQLAKIKTAGRMSQVSTPEPAATRTQGNDGKIGGDGSSAIANFFSKK